QLGDELDQRVVAAQLVRAQDGGARVGGLIEPDRGQRHRGGSLRRFGFELLPAARGLGARGDLLTLGGHLGGALGDLRVAGRQRRLDVAIGAAAAVAAGQRHVRQYQVGLVRVGGGQGVGNRGQQRGQGQGNEERSGLSWHGGHYIWTRAPYNGSRERLDPITSRKNGGPLRGGRPNAGRSRRHRPTARVPRTLDGICPPDPRGREIRRVSRAGARARFGT